MSMVPFRDNRNLSKPTFSSILDGFFGDSFLPLRSHPFDSFKLDVKESDTQYLVEAEMPGVQKEEINITAHDGTLSISVEQNSHTEENDAAKGYIHRERYTSSMSRQIYLPQASNSNITAKLENGVLQVTIPKQESSRSNKIEIQ